MSSFLLRRIGWFLLTVFAVIALSFFMMHSVRGGPFDSERVLHPAAKESIEARYHLDWPLWKQFLQYMGPLNLGRDGMWGSGEKTFSGVLVFDFGPSLRMRDYTVNDIIAQAFPTSALLGSFALFFALLVGVPCGILAALRRGSALDQLLMSGATLGMAVPNFIVAAILILLFSFSLPLFPPAGWGRWSHLFLPAIALGLPFAASIARLTRTGMLETLHQDFVRTALAKGLSQRQVIVRHTLRSGLLPVISYLGPAAAGILTGSLVVEKIFAIPGLGTHFVNSALDRDYTLAMGVTILYTVLIFTLNTLVDCFYFLLDRRVQTP